MEENKNKRVLRVELDNEVKKVSITGKNSDEKVVMRQELSEDNLEMAAGGKIKHCIPNLGNHCEVEEDYIKTLEEISPFFVPKP